MASAELLLKTLDADGNEIQNVGTPTQPGSATTTDNTTAPSDVGAVAAPGTSWLAAPADHTHEGLHSIAADANPALVGDATLASGAGIVLAQAGNVITVNADASLLNKVTFAHDGAAYSVGIGEEILREILVNFDDAASANIKVMLAGIVKASAGAGTFNVRVGATAAGATTGSTVRATFSSTSATEELKEILGSAFANPGGRKLVQITSNNDTAGAKSYIRGINVSIG